MCIFQLAPMLACTYYHYRAEARSSVLTNCVFILALGGCVVRSAATVPVMPALTPAFWGLAVVDLLCFMVSASMLSGKAEWVYKSQPPMVKEAMNREAELMEGSCLLGSSLALFTSLVMGGAKFTSLFFLPAASIVVSLGHWASAGDIKGAMQSLFIIGFVFCLALFS